MERHQPTDGSSVSLRRLLIGTAAVPGAAKWLQTGFVAGFLVAGAITGWSRCALAGTVTFTDGTFSNSNWSEHQLIVTTGPEPSDPNATFTSGQATGNGAPSGYYLDTVQTYTGPNKSIIVAHLASTETYNPSTQGAIADLSFAFDLNFFDYPGTGSDPSDAVAYAPLIEQGSQFYLGTAVLTESNTWDSFSIDDQTANDFVLLNGSANPNFSASGGTIELGFVTGNGECCDATSSTDSGLDNWSATIATVPEPGTVALFSSGLVGLILARGRKRKDI